jgi:ferredoxin-NADP reductase
MTGSAEAQRDSLESRAEHREPIEVVLTSIALAARDTNLYTFERSDRKALPGAGPGAHIDVLLPNGMERQYSLIHSGPQLPAYTIAVKLDAATRGGSRFMHRELCVGDRLRVSHPRNNFPLVKDAPHSVLIAGGIGITPIICMIRRLIQLDRSWQLHYACRSREEAAFVAELERFEQAHLHFDDEAGGALLDIASIVDSASKDAHLYCCGPTPMLAAFQAIAAAWPTSRMHVEYFTPRFTVAQQGGYIVELARSKRTFSIPEGKTILQVLREADIEVSSSCEEGVCSACETRVIAGVPDHRDSVLSEQERNEGRTMMICCSGSKSERLVLDL